MKSPVTKEISRHHNVMHFPHVNYKFHTMGVTCPLFVLILFLFSLQLLLQVRL